MFELPSVAVPEHALEAPGHPALVLVIKLEKPPGPLGVQLLHPYHT